MVFFGKSIVGRFYFILFSMPLPKLICSFLIGLLFICCDTCYAQSKNEQAFYIFEDSAKNLSEKDALQLYKEGKFTKNISNQFNPGFTHSVFWIAYKNERQLPRDSLLFFIGHHRMAQLTAGCIDVLASRCADGGMNSKFF